MRTSALLLGLVAAVALTGCAGPEWKLGRGLVNVTEFTRGGQIARSMEQTALWDGPNQAYTTGFLRGFNRSVARTAIGAYEVITFPFPPYHPMLTSTNNLYPDESIKTKSFPYGGLVLTADAPYPASFKPGLIEDTMFSTDTTLGFSGGDVAPMVPGSRFKVFDN